MTKMTTMGGTEGGKGGWCEWAFHCAWACDMRATCVCIKRGKEKAM